MSLDVEYRDVPIAVRVAQVFGIAASAFMAGTISSFTLYSIPTIMTAPASIAVQQWRLIFLRGAKSMPPLAIAASISYGFLFWRDRGTTGPRSTLFLTAALLVPSIIPWTIFAMRPTNNILLNRAKEADTASASVSATTALLNSEAAEDKSTKALLDKWATLNLVRGVATAIASVLGIWAVVGDTKEMVFDLVA